MHCVLKLIACPVCMAIGALVLNGLARTKFPAEKPRGHHILCNPRRKRGGKGCGKSFTLLNASGLAHLTINAASLWTFLRAIAGGQTTIRACREVLNNACSNRTANRIRSRFTKAQSAIRSLLLKIRMPPAVTSSNPLVQTVQHLKDAFPDHPCPVIAFQLHFQTRFL